MFTGQQEIEDVVFSRVFSERRKGSAVDEFDAVHSQLAFASMMLEFALNQVVRAYRGKDSTCDTLGVLFFSLHTTND